MAAGPKKLSIVFPGQGSQSVGMASALAAEFPIARAVLDEVDEALGESLSTLMAEGPAETLTLTTNAQPALMAAGIAAYRVLTSEGILDEAQIGMMAGHSLGEYTAYCAAGAFDLSTTAKLLRTRGDAMQAAVPVGQGGMAAILGLSIDDVERIADQTGVEVANDNAPGQVVISGASDPVEAAIAAAKEAGAKRALPLPVSAPFHSSLMIPAADTMAEALGAASVSSPRVPVYSNVKAAPVVDLNEIRLTLTEQVTGRVRWTESVKAMADAGATAMLELGAGKVLTGLVKRIDKGVATASFAVPGDLESVRSLLAPPAE